MRATDKLTNHLVRSKIFNPKQKQPEQLKKAPKLRELDDDWAFKTSRAEYEARKQRGSEVDRRERAAWSEEYNRQFP